MTIKDKKKKVLVIGSGPIVIGQAAEFDYSGTQACESLREEGIEVVLINSNPATIMTDPEIADHIYIEPITLPVVEKIIAKERPQGVLVGMGGQTGINMAMDLERAGIFEKYKVQVLGTSMASIEKGENREQFRELMLEIGEPIIESRTVSKVQEALDYAKGLGYPVVVRPAFTLGGAGGGMAKGPQELAEIAGYGLQLSPVHQVLIEKSIAGWKEIEYEIIRDSKGTCITVCNMENIDPVGVHTGDSMVVAPSQTLRDAEHQMLRQSAFRIAEAVGIQGGCNVQFALDPMSLDYAVIEINPRVSRSSALASKATGYPIARISAKIALGMSLDEISHPLTGDRSCAFEPALDYVVVKFPKWPFDKFYNADRHLGTKMMATGEVMAIGTSLEMALLKGLRSLEINAFGLYKQEIEDMSLEDIKAHISVPNDERLFYLGALIRAGYDLNFLSRHTGMDMYFLQVFKDIAENENRLLGMGEEDLTGDLIRDLKIRGYSDQGMAELLGADPLFVEEYRKLYKIQARYRQVDGGRGSLDVKSPYYYSSYEGEEEDRPSKKDKVLVLGSGPIRIGQGIEFDYSSIHCIKTLKKLGYESILINNNPETVSTDIGIADKLYFEPLTVEDVINVIEKEDPQGIILQFGGQTAIKLAKELDRRELTILGTSPESIDRAEDREKFDALLEKLNILRPQGKGVYSLEEGLDFAQGLYPVLVRPSYVLGGQGMEICYGQEDLTYYLKEAFKRDKDNPVLIDQYIQGMEVEVDAISDGKDVFIPGIMEHLERAGVHSGDSISIYPAGKLSQAMEEAILDETKKLALDLGIIGMLNIQYIVKDDQLYIIEVNPRSSRTVPFLSKVTGINIAGLATQVMLGQSLAELGYGTAIGPKGDFTSVKVPIFSTEKLHRVEASLGPEMRSTGEVLGLGKTKKEALYKGFLAAGMDLSQKKRRVLVTLRDLDKKEFAPIAKDLADLGCDFFATEGTAAFLKGLGIQAQIVSRVGKADQDIIHLIRTGGIDLVFNTPTKGGDAKRDGFLIRRASIESGIELFTNLDKAKVFVEVLKEGWTQEAIQLYKLSDLHQA
ncbi:MAG: carbamoyl-phosphate synthase large subunit [Tissierellia bacterium]|nr:carbamoyl-phosphate synthase large subunit [Tissierellia bacterium]